MNLFRGILLAMGLTIAAGCSAASASAYSSLYVFGDSLVDTGNIYDLTGGAAFPPPYQTKRFSNGDIWLDHLADGLNLARPTPSLEGGTNYAFGGGRSDAGNSQLPGGPGLQSELGMFASGLAGPADPNALYVFWIGSNDFGPGGINDVAQSLTNVANALDGLLLLGARDFIVGNLVDVSTIPGLASLSPADKAQISAGVDAFNTGLLSILAARSGVPGAGFHLLDAHALFEAAMANPAAFGLTNTTDPCLALANPANPYDLAGASVCANPDQYLFWDNYGHPTAAVGQILGRAALALLPEPGQWLILLLGLAALGYITVSRGSSFSAASNRPRN